MTVITQNTVKGGYPYGTYDSYGGTSAILTTTKINALKLTNNKLQIIHELKDVSSSPIGHFITDDTYFSTSNSSNNSDATIYRDLYNKADHKYTYIAWC